jgi:hypothetical protein
MALELASLACWAHGVEVPMPSNALLAWQTARTPRLANLEADCLHLVALHPAAPDRVREYIRAFAVLLGAEFQGFCRELHTESTDALVAAVVPVALKLLLRSQCLHGRKLDTGNPTPSNLGSDFNRFSFDFWASVLATDPAHAARRHRLAVLNADFRGAKVTLIFPIEEIELGKLEEQGSVVQPGHRLTDLAQRPRSAGRFRNLFCCREGGRQSPGERLGFPASVET